MNIENIVLALHETLPAGYFFPLMWNSHHFPFLFRRQQYNSIFEAYFYLSGFSEEFILPDVCDRKVQLMREIVAARFDQHTELVDLLEKSGDGLIVFCLPRENPEATLWGKVGFCCASSGEGENWLGRIYHEERSRRFPLVDRRKTL